MTRLALAGLVVAALMGCDMVNTPEQVTDAYRDYLPESASNRYACTKYVQWPDSVIEVDSASYCPFSDSGAYRPVLVRTTWTGIGGCGVVGNGGPAEERLVGGLKGIRRYFGCYRRPIAHPVVPRWSARIVGGRSDELSKSYDGAKEGNQRRLLRCYAAVLNWSEF